MIVIKLMVALNQEKNAMDEALHAIIEGLEVPMTGLIAQIVSEDDDEEESDGNQTRTENGE